MRDDETNMYKPTPVKQKKLSPSLKRALWVLNYCAIAGASAILLSFWSYFIGQAFETSLMSGVRSIAASILPVLIIIYVTFFTGLLTPPSSVPLFNVFFVAAVWTLFILVSIRLIYTPTFPLGEILFSLTTSLMVLSYRRVSREGFISYCYGIIVGFLAYIVTLP